MNITFYGAASEVTGSKHLVEIGGRRILLDCGMVQGRRRESRERNLAISFEAATIEAVVISHAHFDHIGWLPLLIKHGFSGKIFCTGATRDLMELILLDAAKIQRQDAEYANRHAYPGAEMVQPLYIEDDVAPVMARVESLPYVGEVDEWHDIAPGIQVKLYDAGHILGSAVTVIQGQENNQTRRLVYTGDLGRPRRPLLRDPQLVKESAEIALCEATYGERLHHPHDEVEQKLIEVINRAIQTGGKIVVPAFSLGRTQQLIYFLHQLTDAGKIPRLPIIVDSPLAERITTVFAEHQRDYDPDTAKDFTRLGEDPLVFRNLSFTHTVEESKALNTRPGPCMIISASGMITGGRVLHHLRNILPDPKSTVLITGYQADHTPGRRLIKGATELQLFGHMIPVRAQIKVLNDLSAHADATEIEAYLGAISGLRQVWLVHSEIDRAQALQNFLQSKHPDWQVGIPILNQSINV